jgi:hypothetical protein
LQAALSDTTRKLTALSAFRPGVILNPMTSGTTASTGPLGCVVGVVAGGGTVVGGAVVVVVVDVVVVERTETLGPAALEGPELQAASTSPSAARVIGTFHRPLPARVLIVPRC